MAGTHSEERQSQRVKSTDGWIGGTGAGSGGETKANQQRRSNLVFNTQCALSVHKRNLLQSLGDTREAEEQCVSHNWIIVI